MQHRRFTRLRVKCTACMRYGQEIEIEASDSAVRCKLNTTPEKWPIWYGSLIVEQDKIFRYHYNVVDGNVRIKEARTQRSLCTDVSDMDVEDVYSGTWDATNSENSVSNLHNEEEEIASRKATINHVDSIEDKFSLTTVRNGTSASRNSTIHIVCFHLPVKLTQDIETKEWKAAWGESLIARSENSVANDVSTRWYGTVGEVNSPLEEAKIRQVLEPMNCVPLFLSKETTVGAYLGYCKQVLWPSFHNVDILDLTCACWQPRHAKVWDQSVTESWWEAYVEMNRTFFISLVEMVQNSDIVWVHDYHLMLLPSMLSAFLEGAAWVWGEPVPANDATSKVRAQIIFFLHIPFPTSQIFRSLTRGSELLNGIVGAHVVGFHAFDHARHFLNACKRLMGLSHQTVHGGLTGVAYRERTVTVVVRHVSIEPDHISNILHRRESDNSNDREAPFYETALEQRKYVFAGVDTCQRLSGIALKLLAFERFLWEYEHWRGKAALVQIGVVEGKRPADERRTSTEINVLVSRVNGAFPGAVFYREINSKHLSLDRRLDLWLDADVLVVSAIREGLNLAPFEFIYTRQRNPGLVMASEFSATALLLNGALRLNPFDLASTAAAFDAAMAMSLKERAGRHARDLPYVLSRPSGKWTREILQDMQLGCTQQQTLIASSSTSNARRNALKQSKSQPGERTARHLEMSEKCVLSVDIDGALSGTHMLQVRKFPEQSIFSSLEDKEHVLTCQAMTKALDRNMQKCSSIAFVCAVSLQYVVGLTGARHRVILASSAGLCLPHFSEPRRKNNRACILFAAEINWQKVRKAALPVLRWFTARTNGASIIETQGLSWTYHRTDPEWGRIQASRLIVELSSVLAAFQVFIFQHEEGIVDIIPRRETSIVHDFLELTTGHPLLQSTSECRDHIIVVHDKIEQQHTVSDSLHTKFISLCFRDIRAPNAIISNMRTLANRIGLSAHHHSAGMCCVKPHNAIMLPVFQSQVAYVVYRSILKE